MTIIEKIKSEIERRIALYSSLSEDTVNPNRIDEDRQLLSFLNTLEEPRIIFSQKAFEQYDRKQFIDACELEEAKKVYIAGLVLNGRCPDATVKQLKEIAGDAFIAGAGYESKTWCYASTMMHGAYLKGRNDMREQMMKDVGDGEVVKDINNKLAVTAKINLDGFKFGDKVRVIIVKENEK